MQENKESTGITSDQLTNTSFEQLAKDVLGKADITPEELETVFKLDELFEITELTVSASETRQTRPYESNNYFISMKYDLSGAHKLVKSRTATENSNSRYKKYMELRKTLMNLIERKYSTMEDKLRDMIKKQQNNDGLANG